MGSGSWEKKKLALKRFTLFVNKNQDDTTRGNEETKMRGFA